MLIAFFVRSIVVLLSLSFPWLSRAQSHAMESPESYSVATCLAFQSVNHRPELTFCLRAHFPLESLFLSQLAFTRDVIDLRRLHRRIALHFPTLAPSNSLSVCRSSMRLRVLYPARFLPFCCGALSVGASSLINGSAGPSPILTVTISLRPSARCVLGSLIAVSTVGQPPIHSVEFCPQFLNPPSVRSVDLTAGS